MTAIDAPWHPLRIRWRLDDLHGEALIALGDRPNKDGEMSLYWWREGNMSCDCNRSVEFGLDEMPCGERIRIARYEDLATGISYPGDEGEAPPDA